MSAQRTEADDIVKLKDVIRDTNGDGIIDLKGQVVRIRAAVTTEAFPAFRVDDREYRAYVQDETGGIRIVSRKSRPLRKLVVGIEAVISGVLGQYRGCPYLEIADITEFKPAPIITPRVVTLADWDGEALCGQLVKLYGPVHYEDWRYFIGNREGAQIRLFLRPSKNYVPFIAKVRDGLTVTATGIVEQYDTDKTLKSGYRIRPRQLADLHVSQSTWSNKWVRVSVYVLIGLLAMSGCWYTWRWRRAKQHFESPHTQRTHALGTLAGGIAHEFNNYLLAIMGFTEIAQMEVAKDSKAHKHLDQVLDAGQRAKVLIEQILSFGRTKDVALAPTHARDAIQQAVVLLRAVMPASIVVRTKLTSSGDVIMADSGQLSQLLLNLGTNSIHAMPNGGELTVALARVDVDAKMAKQLSTSTTGPHVLLEVSDTGVGMDKDLLSHIFDPFFTTRGHAEGTGLGLSVVQGIIKRHHGGIDVKSTPGEGTQFRIYLPIDSTAEVSTSAEVVVSHPPETKHTPDHDQRILVVDDKEQVMQLVTRLCQSLGYEVDSTRDAQQAESMLRKSPNSFQLLVTDMSMPSMTGVQLAERAQSVAPQVRVLLMTGNSNTLTEQELINAGVDSVITKPFEFQELARCVDALLTR